MAANSLPEALDQLGQQFVDSLRQELDSKRISASGNLYRSVRYEIVGSGDEIGLALFWDDYGDIVDEGRGRISTSIRNVKVYLVDEFKEMGWEFNVDNIKRKYDKYKWKYQRSGINYHLDTK